MDKLHEALIAEILSDPRTPKEHAAKAEIERLMGLLNKPTKKARVKAAEVEKEDE